MLVSSLHRRLISRSLAAIATATLLAGLGCSSSSNEDASGLRLATVAVDSDNDGVIEDLFTWDFDSEGRATVEDFDAGADGSVETRYRRVQDGNTLRVERDENADGSVEGLASWTVDENGLPVSFAISASDDGVAAENVAYIAEAGRIVRADIDMGADGSIDSTARYDYDASGRIAGAEFDDDGDGVTDGTLNVLRDETGRVVRLEEDFGNDGGIDYVRTLTYEEGPCDANDIANVANPFIDICL